jgi:hypothetical protein
MWTIVRFELLAERHYGEAFALLRAAGFQPHRRPAPGAPALSAAVVRDLLQDPAVVSRAVFEALADAGLEPLGVAAFHVDVGRAPRGTRALAEG